MRLPKTFAALVFLFAGNVYAALPETVVLDVQNMSCPVCPITVRKSLEKVSGVRSVTSDFEHKTATVNFDPDKTPAGALTSATANAGFLSTARPPISR